LKGKLTEEGKESEDMPGVFSRVEYAKKSFWDDRFKE